ncbi:hypothetical protein [Ralstonia pseudosolanacearum]|uniref:hypothetical protein n=1 Tax=Ralstonia pseudosolanacearum TaxID=1310165 RepID=UPI0033974EB7
MKYNATDAIRAEIMATASEKMDTSMGVFMLKRCIEQLLMTNEAALGWSRSKTLVPHAANR